MQTKHCRNTHAARQNGVCGGASDIGDKGGKVLIFEGHHVRWRKIVTDDDRRFAFGAFGHLDAGVA